MARKSASPKASVVKRRKKSIIAVEGVFDHLTLKHVRLISVQTQLQITDGKTPTVAEINTTTAVGPSQDEAHIHANTYVLLTAKPKDGGDGCSTLVVTAHYQCVYHVQAAKASDFIAHSEIIAGNGTLVAWPHLRELVQSLTARMEIPPFILPLYTIGPKKAQLGPAKPATTKKAARRKKKP